MGEKSWILAGIRPSKWKFDFPAARSEGPPCRQARQQENAKRSSCATETRNDISARGVLKAVANVNGEIAKGVTGVELDQRSLDRKLIELDGTPTKSRLGANALLGVSMAAAHASAAEAKTPLYVHLAQGTGERWLPGSDDEHPQRRGARRLERRCAGVHGHAGRRSRASRRLCEPARKSFTALRSSLRKRGLSTGVGDEGGFAPSLKSNRDALELVLEAVADSRVQGRRRCVPRPRRGVERNVGQRPLCLQEIR